MPIRLALGLLLLLWLNANAQTLLVLNKEDANLAFVDLKNNRVLGTVPVGEQPHEVAVSDDGRMAFVANYGNGPKPGNTISVIDVPGRKELQRVDVSPLGRPHGIFWYGGKVYFTSEASKLISRYDPVANKIDWMLGTGQNTTHMVMLSRDGSQIYTANIGGNTLTIIDVARNYDETVIPVGKGPEGFDISPDGKQIWMAHSQDGGVSMVDLASKKVIGTFDVGTKRSNRLKFTPDGKTVLISDLAAGELLFVDVTSRKVTKRIAIGKAAEGILVLPDGSKAYVAANGENAIQIVDLKRMAVVGKIEPGKGPDGMALIR